VVAVDVQPRAMIRPLSITNSLADSGELVDVVTV
jgi:hypothetical protein